ncbi:hypothetical protein Tsubulata_009457 [Turnera subulata]|uniref:Kinesin motor domain-containing protein n=1 Tax=Turnera subulata TaxID=218843 RepID=A0A9Q0JRG9_9ROSI|nr:hypothetical protein Tsubulata_009457 [Turnera subulata]
MANAAGGGSVEQNQGLETVSSYYTDPASNEGIENGPSTLGFSLTSPHLVICAGSPDIPAHTTLHNSLELSLQEGIEGSDTMHTHRQPPSVKFSPISQTFNKDSSFELLHPLQPKLLDAIASCHSVGINAGCRDRAVVLGAVNFLEDACFVGGDTVWTSATVEDTHGRNLPLYQTARVGNLSYCFKGLQQGRYIVALHLAEIVFTNGPPEMRVFDVFIQEKKVVSCLDIYGQVGANNPLVISDLEAFVSGEDGLSIRFDGVIGSPIVCGISITKDSANIGESQLLPPAAMSQAVGCLSPKQDNGDSGVDGDYQRLQRKYDCQNRELEEMKMAMEALKRDNQLKNMECQDAWNSLQELQNELMRKSMHVGSLAFAIEGQVKEKSRWFSSLRDLTRKLKIMKMDHIKILEEVMAYKKFLEELDEMKSTIQCTIERQAELYRDLEIKFIQGVKERKELYNKVLELKGNIKVFCRCRPLKPEEIPSGASAAIDFQSAKDGELTVISNGLPKKTFKFDAVFDPQADQADVFKDTAPFATSVLDGYNVCIFAYGQTGTGKTFTMEGTEEARGVNFRTLEELFCIIKQRQLLYKYDVSVSVLEVYNEQIRDLLVADSQPGAAAKRLEIRQVSEGLHHVPGLGEAHVNNMSEVWEVLQTGSNARAVGSTNANEHSSRSHCIHCVMVKGVNLLNGECTRSKLWLVDLAGSERVAKTEVQGERLKETQNINRSLSALGDVISALASKSPHIPFRNSKLTHLLQDSLGGDSKTLMFVQISPNENDLGETLSSLSFASRVRGVELGPARRQLDNSDLLRYKQLAEKSKLELKSKDVQIKKMEEKMCGFDLKIKEKDLKCKHLQEKVKELESQLLVERKLARQHVDSKIAELQQQKKVVEDDQPNALPRPPLAGRKVGINKNISEPVNSGWSREEINAPQPLLEKSSYRPTSPLRPFDLTEKENNPGMAEQKRVPKRTGRASFYITEERMPAGPAPRRNTLIPAVNVPSLVQPPPSLSASPLTQAVDKREDSLGREGNCLPEQTHCDSPKGMAGTKKLSALLRRSLQKKILTRSPVQQQLRRGGINVGMEKVRISIGSRGRMAPRLLLGNGRKPGMKETQKKHLQTRKQKERGWNSTTTARPGT